MGAFNALILLPVLLLVANAGRQMDVAKNTKARQLLGSTGNGSDHTSLHKAPVRPLLGVPVNLTSEQLAFATSETATAAKKTVFSTGTHADFVHLSGKELLKNMVSDLSTESGDAGTNSSSPDAPHRRLSSDYVYYRNGGVMNVGAFVYIIYAYGYSASKNTYTGDGWSSSDTAYINNFFQYVSTSSVFQHLSAYGVRPVVQFLGAGYVTLNTDNTVMSDTWARAMVQYVISNNWVQGPYVANTVFHVVTDTGLVPWTDPAMCSSACGWHNEFSYNGYQVKYSWDPQPQACALRGTRCYSSTSVPANVYDNALVGIMYHELVEAMTDPIPGTGWVDPSGEEVMDLCAWQYGNPAYLYSSSCNCYQYYNMQLGSYKYLVQGMWAISGSKQLGCVWS